MVDIKSTSNAAWWIKQPKKHHRTTLCQDMTDLFRNMSMHGYNKILETESLLYEKILWLCLHVVNLAIVIAVLSYTWEQFVSQYFAVYIQDPIYPIENIPFPSVSICSNNRISRQAAKNYARELSRQDPANRTEEQFFQYITYFNSLYYKFERNNNYDEYERFQSFLDVYGTDANETYFNIRKTLEMLTPNCRDLITKCLLNGKEIDCFGKDAFQKGFTMYGPCCIFNANNSYGKRNSTFTLKTSELGLSVLINASHSDDVVSLLNMDAYIALIHNPDDFPDIRSGSVIEAFPINNMEALIGLAAEFMNTSQQLRTFEPSFRKCYFDDETPDEDFAISSTYSFSNCITSCRVRSVLALCNCVPFYVPLKLMLEIGMPYCNLHHVFCLKRYDFKWRNVLTKSIAISGLEREVEEGLYCAQCLPSCEDIQYDISLMSLPTDRYGLLLDNSGGDIKLKLQEMSLLRVYFARATSLYYKRVISNNWEESFSTVGNILSIFLGFCMVAVFEILFFATKYLYIALKAFILNSENNPKLLKKRYKAKKKLYILP